MKKPRKMEPENLLAKSLITVTMREFNREACIELYISRQGDGGLWVDNARGSALGSTPNTIAFLRMLADELEQL